MSQPITDKQRKYRRLGFEACYLSACALHNTMPEAIGNAELEALYPFCKFHSITSIVAMALENRWRENNAEETVTKPWRQARDKAIRKNILLNAERERLFAYLESIGCWYMPLKGTLLQFDYPQFGMRQMSDNDILCDPEKTRQIRQFMLESGYSCGQYQQGHHDEYSRPPVYNYEIHRSLFKPEEAPLLASYYRDIHERSRKDPENGFGYHLSPSDFYIYITAHAFNHFQESGIGIRHLLDVYVFLRKHGDALDRAYLDRELKTLGMLEFESWCARVAETLFREPSRKPELGEEDMELLDAFFASGTRGTETQLFQKSFEKFSQGKKPSRLRFFFSRMFPSRQLLSVAYPVVRNHGWLVPFVWVYRLVRSVARKPGRVLRELKSILSRKK